MALRAPPYRSGELGRGTSLSSPTWQSQLPSSLPNYLLAPLPPPQRVLPTEVQVTTPLAHARALRLAHREGAGVTSFLPSFLSSYLPSFLPPQRALPPEARVTTPPAQARASKLTDLEWQDPLPSYLPTSSGGNSPEARVRTLPVHA
jgi:hypothetical protein